MPDHAWPTPETPQDFSAPGETTWVKADEHIRAIVREEIASLAGLALRRTQDVQLSRDPDRNLAMDIVNSEAAQFWGEVLSQYGGDPARASSLPTDVGSVPGAPVKDA